VVAWVGLAALAERLLDLPLRDLFSATAARSVASFAASTWPPDLSPGFLRELAPAALVTLAVSVLGTALAAAMGLWLAYPAAWRVQALRRGAGPPALARRLAVELVSWTARALLNLGRTLPELLWALLLIFAVGLGPFAGALALGVHTAGVLGRLYAEVLEEVPAGPVRALESAGASMAAASAFAVLPQAAPQLLAYTLYRWEVAIRASAVMGVVGAGGIGQLLHVSLSLFHHHRTLTLVAVIVAMVSAVDLLSGWLRRRVLEGPARPEAAAPPDGAPAVADAW
jgi:phosphonate transport system permease protein